MSKQFLIAYDYGMGGLWGVIDAASEEEIKSKYPELMIVRDRPGWMTQARFDELCQRERHAIDDPPSGILNVVIADRKKKNMG